MATESKESQAGKPAVEEASPLPPSSTANPRIYEIEGNLASVETIIADRRASWESFLNEDNGKQADPLKRKIEHLFKLP